MTITSDQGITIPNVLIYVNNTNIDNTRKAMKGDVWYMIAKKDGGYYPPFNIQQFESPYNPSSMDNSAKQFYLHLKTLPQFANAIDA